MKSSIWVKKYAPKTISDIIYQDERQQKFFQQMVDDGDITQHLFLKGVRGTGKSSTAIALINDLKVDPSDVLKINCSDEKIDALRSKVTSFAMTMPLGKFKVVRLEEIDYMSLDGQALLRNLMEETQGSCRYIATCNYANKVIPELKSRFHEVYFKSPDKDKIALRMAEILEKEEVDFAPEVLIEFVDVAYPDVRKTIQLLQGNTQDKKLLKPTSSSAVYDWKFGLLDCISSGDFKKARKLVCESASKEEHEDVYRFLYENVEKLKVKDKEAAIVTIAQYLYSHALVADTEINMAACFISLSKC